MVIVLPILVLGGTMAVQAIYCGDFRPYVPLILGSVCAIAIGMARGRSWEDLSRETFQAVGSIASALILYVLIGPIISAWIASGTLPALIIWGSRGIGRMTYLPISFVLMGLTSILLGSGISAFGTMGIALLSIGQAMGFPLWLITSVLGSGAFWGNAASPIATVNCLAVAVTGSSQEEFNHRLPKQILLPFLLCLAAHAAVGIFFSPASDVPAMSFTELEEIFKPDVLCMVPPLLLIALVALKAPTLAVFFFSIAAAVIVALLKGTISPAQIPALINDGYRYAGSDVMLHTMLDRGGIASISSIIFTVMLAMLFGGSYQASGALGELLEILTRRVKTPLALRRLANVCVVLTTIVTGSSTMAVALVGTLFAPKAEPMGLRGVDLAFAIAPASLTVGTALPWGVSGSALIAITGLSLSGGDFSGLLFIPFTFASFFTPLCQFFKKPLPLNGRE